MASRKPVKGRRRQKRRLEKLLEEERPAWAEGKVIAGLDEAGAGPLAGPVMAGCVVLDPEKVGELLGVDDSKRLSQQKGKNTRNESKNAFEPGRWLKPA